MVVAPGRGRRLPFRAVTTSAPRSPLGAVLAFTAILSFASTGGATLGIFFVTRRVYGFDAPLQYLLGLVLGGTYVAGALSAARLQRLVRRSLGLSMRATLTLVTVLLGLVLLVPAFTHARLPFFLTIAVFAPTSGLLWPLVESYVSGGRRGPELRRAIGAFNVVWSGALVPAFWVLSPLLERAPGALFPGLCVAHLVALVFVRRFPREAAPHGPATHAPAPASLRAQLGVHRVLLASAYLVMYALTPALPGLLDRAGLAASWQSVVASTWLLARVFGFWALGRWHGWHGRWSVAWGGELLLLVGFGLVVTAPLGPAPLVRAVPGLVAFGLGMALLYTAALDYAFEVGGDESGGGHEALIGLGYTLGPACGLGVVGLEAAGLIATGAREPTLLAVLVALSAGAALVAWTRRGASAG